MAPYCASKYGVVAMTEALNAELSGQGIHVIAACPGVIDTPIARIGAIPGRMQAIRGQVTATYAKQGTQRETVAEAVLHAIQTRKKIVTAPRNPRGPGSEPDYLAGPGRHRGRRAGPAGAVGRRARRRRGRRQLP
jgi:short-subunit dehydrogenase